MEEGFVFIPHSILNSSVWRRKEKYSKLEAFIYLVKEARWQKQETMIKGIKCEKNQLVRTFSELMASWNLSNKNEVKRYLDFFEEGGWIRTEKFPDATLITIENEPKRNVYVTASVTTKQPKTKGTKDTDVTDDVTRTLPKRNASRTRVITESCLFEDIDNKQETNKNNSPIIPQREKPKGYENYDFSFVDDSFYDVFVKWLDYKREGGKKKHIYANQRTLEDCYQSLVNTCKGIPEAAMEIVQYSIASCYQGLFAPRDFWYNWNQRHSSLTIQPQPKAPAPQHQEVERHIAYGRMFNTQAEADAFYDEQERIRKDYFAGKFKAASNSVDEHLRMGDAVKVIDGVIYDYE